MAYREMRNIDHLHRIGMLDADRLRTALMLRDTKLSVRLPVSAARLLHDALVLDVPLEALEEARSWPRRSGKVAIALALDMATELLSDRLDHLAVDAPPDPEEVSDMLSYVCAADAISGELWRDRFGLTGTQARLCELLERAPNRQLTRESIYRRLYASRPEVDWPEVKIVDIMVCKIRKRLAGSPLRIVTIWGEGYRLEGALADEAA